jgi:hypothetical protein
MDQESKAFNSEIDEFENTYGFRHDCRCDQDYTEGRVGEVPECFIEMVSLAMQTCREQKTKLDIYEGVVRALHLQNEVEGL